MSWLSRPAGSIIIVADAAVLSVTQVCQQLVANVIVQKCNVAVSEQEVGTPRMLATEVATRLIVEPIMLRSAQAESGNVVSIDSQTVEATPHVYIQPFVEKQPDLFVSRPS